MPFYPDTKTFDDVMTDLFHRVLAQPEIARQLHDSRTVLRIMVTEPPFNLLVDARSNPPRFIRGGGATHFDTGIRLSADTLHAIWLNKIKLRDAYTSGRVKVDGNPLTALPRLMRLADLFRSAEKLYPVVLQERGMM